jgi:hypothetical protein
MDVDRVFGELTTINTGYEWLQYNPGNKVSRQTSAWSPPKRVALLFRVTPEAVHLWLKQGLLPYYRGTPSPIPCRVYDIPAAYCVGVMRYANGRPITGALLVEYRRLCQEAGQIV